MFLLYYGTVANQKARQAITEAFFVLLSEKSLSAITVTNIIKKAGVARSTYYHNFYYKEEIVDNFMDSIYHQLLAKENIENKQKLQKAFKSQQLIAGIESSFLLLKKNQEKIKLIYHNGFGYRLKEMLDQHVKIIFGNFNNKDHYKNYLIAGAIQNVLLEWLECGAKESPQEMAQIVYEFVQNNAL